MSGDRTLVYDMLNFYFSIPVIILSIVASYLSHQNYQRLQAPLFKFGSRFCFLIAIWFTRFILLQFFDGPQYQNLISILLPTLFAFAVAGFAYLVVLTEYTQMIPNERIIRIIFYVAGMVAMAHFHPQMYSVTWTGQRWEEWYGIPLILLLGFMIIIGLMAIIPLILRILTRSRSGPHFDIRVRTTFLLTIFFGATAILLEIIRRFASLIMVEIPFLFNHDVIYIILMTCFMVSLILILYKHPTIFFTGVQKLESLHIVERSSSLPLYDFMFTEKSWKISPDLFAMACNTTRLVLLEALHTKFEIGLIKTEDNEVLINEGQNIVGFLVTKGGSDLLNALLKLIVSEFELKYNSKLPHNSKMVKPSLFKSFDLTIQKYFEFALPHPVRSSLK